MKCPPGPEADIFGLFDHLVGAGKDGWRNGKAEILGRFEIAAQNAMSALPQQRDMRGAASDLCFGLIADIA